MTSQTPDLNTLLAHSKPAGDLMQINKSLDFGDVEAEQIFHNSAYGLRGKDCWDLTYDAWVEVYRHACGHVPMLQLLCIADALRIHRDNPHTSILPKDVQMANRIWSKLALAQHMQSETALESLKKEIKAKVVSHGDAQILHSLLFTHDFSEAEHTRIVKVLMRKYGGNDDKEDYHCMSYFLRYDSTDKRCLHEYVADAPVGGSFVDDLLEYWIELAR